MTTLFGKYGIDHDVDQQKIEKTIYTNTPVTEEKRTTLSLSLTVRDKKALKMMAMEKETTIAAIIHEWIAEHQKGRNE